MSRAVIARAPTRLDFAGGWTDVAPYAEREGGAVCNLAIARYATATVDSTRHGRVVVGDRLVDAALQLAPVGATACLTSDFPVGSGLGGSSAAGVALALAVATLTDTTLDRAGLAERSRLTETGILGIAGGSQDHYAAAYGGALLLHCGAKVQATRLAVRPSTLDELARRGILVYTGESRISGDTIIAVRDAYVAGDRTVLAALASMKRLAHAAARALESGDVDALGVIIGEHWIAQRSLHPAITTPRIEEIGAAVGLAGGLGLKALGASGGGCVLAIARAGHEAELAEALAPFGEIMSWTADLEGAAVVADMHDKGSAPTAS